MRAEQSTWLCTCIAARLESVRDDSTSLVKREIRDHHRRTIYSSHLFFPSKPFIIVIIAGRRHATTILGRRG